MARGYGYIVYAVPILSPAINLASILTAQEARNAIGVGGFIDPTNVVAANAVLTERNLSAGQDYYLTLNEVEMVISNAALTANVATITVPTHTRTVGNRVKVTGLGSPFTSLNGTFVITAVTATTISYALVGANISSGVIAGTAVSGTDLKLDGTDPPFRILGLKSGPLTSNTDTEETPTWDDVSQGFKRTEALSKDASIAFSGKTLHSDAGYQILRLTELGNVSRDLFLKLARIGPVGFNETTFGYGRFDTFKEGNDAGKVVDWQADFNFDGPAGLVRHR